MTLQEASQHLDISKKRLWRAVKSGQLEAARVQKGARWEYRVSREQLNDYRHRYLDSLEMQAVSWGESKPELPTLARSVPTLERSTTQDLVPELFGHKERAAPVGNQDLLDRLKQAQRLNAELEQQVEVLQDREVELDSVRRLLSQALKLLQTV